MVDSKTKLERIDIPEDWKSLLADEFLNPYFDEIRTHYIEARKQNQPIFPYPQQIFYAFKLTPLKNLKVVILGQDPYHGAHYVDGVLTPQAMGLSFSVPRGVPIPPSLKNIYQELAQSLHIPSPNHGDLSGWAKQGVLLLNSILSVQANAPASHRHFGWERFTDGVISALSSHKQNLVFMLWGNYAKKKAPLIDSRKHKIITAPHPSPLARGFVGSGVFKQADMYLAQTHQAPIEWGRL